MHKEIGSNFWFNRYKEMSNKEINLDFLNIEIKDIAYFSTGRGAILYILKQIQKNEKKALLPSFTCSTVIEPFIKENFDVNFYNINLDLTINKDSFLESLNEYEPTILLLHGYFGFNTLDNVKETIKELRKKGIIIIEDITQTFYSKFKHLTADYYICSLRKWAELPDGAIAINKNSLFLNKPNKFDFILEESKISAFHSKYMYMENHIGEKSTFLKKFAEAERILSNQKHIFSIGKVSRKIQANLDIDLLRKKRRENYIILDKYFKKTDIVDPVFKEFKEEVVPLYYPIYTKGYREKVQSYLAENEIYAPIIWPKPKQIDKELNKTIDGIYNRILAIPCDQRYDVKDMKRIIKTFISYSEQCLK